MKKKKISICKGSHEIPLIKKTISSILHESAKVCPNQKAIISHIEDKTYTYKELNSEVNLACRALINLGAKKDDRISIWSTNRTEWLITNYAAMRLGLIVVTINPAFRTSEVKYVLENSESTFLFMAENFRTFSYLDSISSIKDNLIKLKSVVVFGNKVGPYLSWDSFMKLGFKIDKNIVSVIEEKIAFDQPCHIQYTSGTTGKPKGALLTNYNLINNGYFVGLNQNFSINDKICLPVPFFHCFGSVLGAFAALSHGSCIVLPSESFDPKICMEVIQKYKCTALYGVPMMFISILSLPNLLNYNFKSLRTGAIGASPCPKEVMKKIINILNIKEITIVYGMTETSPISFQTNIGDDVDLQVSTVGNINPHIEAKVIDSNKNFILDRGKPGELCIKGYSVMKEYWKNKTETKKAIDKDGWMRTGDLVLMRDDGYLEIVGRIKDTIIKGGENIYPREVEEFLIKIEQIEQAYVFGVPDKTYGEIVGCWVKLEKNKFISENQIKNKCKNKIASFKIPSFFRIVDEFPMTASGKVQKFKMSEKEIALKINK